PDKVHYPDVGHNDCYCYANKLKCDDCPAFRNYCPARTSTGAGHPECQCTDYRACQPGNCSLCHAIRSRLGNAYNSPGYVQARGYGQVEFYVRLIVRRVIPGGSSLNDLTILLKRPKPKTGGDPDDKETAKPWKFERNMPTCWSAAWNVTKMKGRWEMWVAGQKDVFKDFKIDKRAQIVIVARSWVGAIHDPSKPRWHGPCWGFAAEAYNHVGFNLPDTEREQYDKTTEDKNYVKARLIFFWVDATAKYPAHVAIQTGIDSVVDINCGGPTAHSDPVSGKLNVSEHDLARMIKHYPKHELKSPKELQDLDGE
ncbi:MAG: C40 family peptidase, partial [Armatimonadetes bacterium]|nr:C40 family peptidase [Armatimonadota bacterium]